MTAPATESPSNAYPSAHQREVVFLFIAALFIAALVVCNLIAGKLVHVDLGFLGFSTPFVVSAGALPYPVTFLVTDILSEIYGRKRANRVVLSGFVASIFVMGVLLLGAQFEAIDGSRVDDETYNKVFGSGTRAIIASMVAYLCAQFIDIRLFHFWKRLTHGKHLWLRNNASTITSQLLDSALVVTVLFAGLDDWPASRIASTVLDLWLFKMLIALVDTPLFYAAVYLLRDHVPAEDGPHTTFT